MHVVCCVRVHFSAHQAVGSDLLPGFLKSLTNLVSKWVDSGFFPVAGTVHVLQTSAFHCSCKGILRSRWPHLMEIIYFCSARCGRHRGIWFQPTAGCFDTQGHVGPHGHPEIGYKVGIWHGALATVLSSFINNPLLLHGRICSALHLPYVPYVPGLHLQCLAQYWSCTGLAPDFINTVPPSERTIWCWVNVKGFLFTY